MNEETAKQFAAEWLDAWNSHDLDRILAHYADNIEFYSPFVAKALGEPSGKVSGKDHLGAYFARALAAYPELHFDLFTVLVGVKSVTLHYRSVNRLIAAEVMLFDDRGKVATVLAHYAKPEHP